MTALVLERMIHSIFSTVLSVWFSCNYFTILQNWCFLWMRLGMGTETKTLALLPMQFHLCVEVMKSRKPSLKKAFDIISPTFLLAFACSFACILPVTCLSFHLCLSCNFFLKIKCREKYISQVESILPFSLQKEHSPCNHYDFNPSRSF